MNRTYGSEQGVPGEMAAEDRNSYVYWIDYAANRRICYTNVEENIEQNSQVKAGFFGCHANIYQPDSDHVYTSCQSGVYEHIPLDQVTFCSPPSPASPPPLPPPLVPTLPCFVGSPTSGTLSYPNEESVSVLPTVNSLGIDIIRGELGGGFTQAEAMGDTVVAVATDPVPTETLKEVYLAAIEGQHLKVVVLQIRTASPDTIITSKRAFYVNGYTDVDIHKVDVADVAINGELIVQHLATGPTANGYGAAVLEWRYNSQASCE